MAGPLDKLTKLDGRLRCVANGRTEVNSVRAQQNGAVRIKPESRAAARSAPELIEGGLKSQGRSLRGLVRGKSQDRLPSDVEVNVFVLLNRLDAETPKAVSRRNGRVGVATVTLSGLKDLDKDPAIQAIELAETLKSPRPQLSTDIPQSEAAPRFNLLNSGAIDLGAGRTFPLDAVGENVLVGIIDVGGIDFAHRDFLDDKGASRVIAIWDQGGDAFDPPQLPLVDARADTSEAYGSEILASDIASALRDAAAAKLTPHDLAPQSQRERGSHATHVASIAAGRSGVCKRAKIGAVLVSLADGDLDRRKSFYDTTRLVDGIAYLIEVARREKLEAVSINISLGTNGGSHDGAEYVSRWIDTSMFEPGRAICVAAGNSGQDREQFAGDAGVWSGRVHASGRIAAAALRRDLEWIVVGNGFEDVSENELEIWYGAEDEFVVELFSPGGQRIGPVAPGERVENAMLKDRTFVSIYNTLSDPKNGDNRVSLYLSPFMGDPVVGITAGTWRVRLTGRVIRNGGFNAWIERDDPGRAGVRAQWYLPSFFGAGTYVDDSTISSLACGPRVIGVANYDEARELMNATSSQGPTRDGRSKPEIAAPGTDIVAAYGFDPSREWIAMSGTSMASPHVTGVAALMLSINPALNAAQIGGIIRRTSRPLPGASYDWRNDAGFGVIDAEACLREAARGTLPVDDLTEKAVA